MKCKAYNAHFVGTAVWSITAELDRLFNKEPGPDKLRENQKIESLTWQMKDANGKVLAEDHILFTEEDE
jgi:hypothetical protein